MSEQHPKCYACGKVFDPAKRSSRTMAEFNLTAQGPLCCNQPECRGRVLSRKYEERGLRRWARQTQEELLLVMDLPPRGWNPAKKWESVHNPHERIFAALKFYSICWPVCLEFAVQTNEDGEPIKEHGEWKRHTHRSLANILRMKHPLVTRNIEYLKSRTMVLTDEDERLYPNLAPGPLDAVTRGNCTVTSESDLKDLAVLPPKAFNLVARAKAELDLGNYTVIREAALGACTELKRAISAARTHANQTVLGACHAHATLLSRPGDYRQTRRASSPSAAAENRPPSKPSLDKEERRAAAEYLYAEIPLMQDTFPNAPFSKPRFSMGKADRILVGHILDALEPTNYNAMGFILFVSAKFKGLDADGMAKLKPRSPNDPGGPQSLGLLIEWAKDYAATFHGRTKGAGG